MDEDHGTFKPNDITISHLYASKLKYIRQKLWKYALDNDYVTDWYVNQGYWMSLASMYFMKGHIGTNKKVTHFKTFGGDRWKIFRYMIAKIYVDHPRFRHAIFVHKNPKSNTYNVYVKASLAVAIRKAVLPQYDRNKFFVAFDPETEDVSKYDEKYIQEIYTKLNKIRFSMPLEKQKETLGLKTNWLKKTPVELRKFDITEAQKAILMETVDVPYLIDNGFLDEYINFLCLQNSWSLKEGILYASKQPLFKLVHHDPVVADWEKVILHLGEKAEDNNDNK